MKDFTNKLREIFESRQTMEKLKAFVQKSEKCRYENDWKAFATRVVGPAFAQCGLVFGKRFHLLPEQSGSLGFKVKDFSDSEFWFWIEFRGKVPSPQARRKFHKSRGSFVVSAPALRPKRNYELADVTVEDIVKTVTYAYEKSFFER